MKLCPREEGKLILRQAGVLAQSRLSRNIKLNHPETVALISCQILEMAREGKSVSELMDLGRKILGHNQVMKGVASMIDMVQVEATFPDGTKLVTVDKPICQLDGDMALAFLGSPYPPLKLTKGRGRPPKGRPSTEPTSTPEDVPGKVEAMEGELEINAGREKLELVVANMGDRPIQVGSHYHFTETNALLKFDRVKAVGFRLDILAGTAIRFEPGETKTVRLCRIAGNQRVYGGNNLIDGLVDDASIGAVRSKVAQLVQDRKFQHETAASSSSSSSSSSSEPDAKRQKVDDEDADSNKTMVSRAKYAQMYGPTKGDRVRLGDTELWVQVEDDKTVYGDECVFGGGKVLREGMGMMIGDGVGDNALDTVITNALILDYSGIYKADVGIKKGHIVGIGKAGNPDCMAGVTPNMVVGVHTEAIAGEGLILTAGALDVHIHYICPQIATDAIASGITTLLGGGTGPASGTKATTCTPGPDHVKMMIQASEAFPLNFGFTGKGNSSKVNGLKEVIEAGALGLKLHEDWGTTPAAIDAALTVAEEMDVQITIHTDTLNESACCEDSIAAFKGRTIHTYHSEGAGGGHAPDIITVCSEKNVIPSSTNPTRPYTKNTIDEHLDMLMVCHHLKKNIKEDVAFAESRIRAETIAAEDILHDMGAIAIVSSDSQAMGRVAEVIGRTWQTAHKMKVQRGALPEDKDNNNDNFRAKRYVAKYTINPALAHGMSHLIGSVEVGKFADLVLWDPRFFGAKPELVIKGGIIAYAQMGDANASVPTCEPVRMQEMFASKGKAIGDSSITFVSNAAVTKNIKQLYGLTKRVEAVKGCRSVDKTHMKLNDALPKIKVDPETYRVTVDGEVLSCEPLEEVPLAQKYSLF